MPETYIYRCVLFVRREAVGRARSFTTLAGANGGEKRLTAYTETAISPVRHAIEAVGESNLRYHCHHRQERWTEELSSKRNATTEYCQSGPCVEIQED